jgi:hypothetical protein
MADNTVKELKDLKKKLNAQIQAKQDQKQKVIAAKNKIDLEIADLQATKATIDSLITQLGG